MEEKTKNNSTILGVRIDNFSEKETLEKVESFLREDKFHQIATINPEFILEAQKNIEFKNILNNCDLNVADGFGIKLAFRRFGWHLKTRITGVDLMQEILKIAQEKKLKIFLAARKDGLSGFKETKDAILKKYPDLEIAGADLDKTQKLAMDAGEADMIFCNFGAPFQEIFLHSLKNEKSGKIKLAMGVGGSFDFLTGKAKRAPKIMQFFGLEWFWRIFQPQPWKYKKKRLKRIWNAVVIFMIKIIF